jgi:hypothetical protein
VIEPPLELGDFFIVLIERILPSRKHDPLRSPAIKRTRRLCFLILYYRPVVPYFEPFSASQVVLWAQPIVLSPTCWRRWLSAQLALEDHNMPSTMSQKAVDELIRKTIGPKRAVEALFKSSVSKKWARYEIYGMDSGVVYVNLDKGTAHVMDANSRCAKKWAKRQARTARIAEAKITKATTR